MAVRWSDLERILASHRPTEPRSPPPSRSVVAAILDLAQAPRVLLMLRSEYATDPWSGHVSLPGGRHDARDPDLVATAIRETREEVGIDLARAARLIGRLGPHAAVSRGKVLPMDITPFVFALDAGVEPVPGAEAQAVFWLPLDLAASGALDDEYAHRRDDEVRLLPCWRFEGRVVWGLTYRILQALLVVAGAL